MNENTLQNYQEEDVTKIINKSLEMKDGKLTEKGWSDISKTLQAYSDKRFETARYLFVQNGKIIRHVAISVQNPNATISKPDENVTYLEKLKTFAQNTNSSVVFVHNHPSGYVEPSLADQDTTEYLHNFFGDSFAGHIILDHGKFGIYEPTNQKWQALIDNKIYEMEEGKTHFSIHGSQIGIKKITNEKDLLVLANYAKKIDNQANWNRDDWIPAFWSTHQGIVQSLEYLHNDDLKVENYQGLINQIKHVGRDVGCNYIYLVPKTFEQKMLCEAFAQKTRIVQDIYFEKEDGTYELSNYSGGDIFSSITKEEIKMDDSINYEITNEEDKDIMEEKKEQNPWFEKLSDIEKEAVLSDMRINLDLIGEYHSELEEANIDFKEYDRPPHKWLLDKINYKNLNGEFSYFNENNIGQQRHYAEVIDEYKKELAAKQEINDEVIMDNSIVPNDSNFEPVTTEDIKDGYLFNPKTVKRESLSEADEKRLLEDFDVIGKFENDVGQWSEYSNIYNFFDFHNHSDEFLKFMDAAREEKEISSHRDNISFVQHYLENKLEIPIYKDGERISSNWTTEEREKYSTVISKLNFIAQAIVKSHEPYVELPSGRENVIDNSEKLELLGAKNITELEKTLQKIKDELNPQYQENLEKNINEIHNKQEINVEVMDVNDGLPETVLEADYEENHKENIDEIQRQMDIDNGLIDENGNKIENEILSQEDLDYIHSEEFISRFGDWEKANRLEKLKNSQDLEISDEIYLNGIEISDIVNKLQSTYSKDNLTQLQSILTDVGNEKIEQLRKERNLDEFAPLLLTNNDIGKEFGIKKEAVHEISRHNFFTKGHIQAVQEIDKLIENSIYIGKEGNEDNRDPSLKEFYYCLRGVKIGNEDYTAKCVFVLNNKNELYYDQNLSEIEKGRIVDTILKNNMLETSSPLQKGADSFEQIRQESPDKFYDKRLNRICQVPQMPYLEKNIITGKWQPTKEAIKAVKEGKLFIEKKGQKYVMNDSNLNQNNSISSTDILTQKINGSEIIKENVQNTSESVATNFLLEKLNKAGIETIIDKVAYENMLAYVKEVNICLEMLEAEQYPVQMMDKKEKGSSLGTHLGNQQASGRTLYHKYNISEQERQEMLTDFETNLDISLFSNDATDFIQQIKERFNLGVEKSDYAHINIDGQKYTIRISDHGVNTNTVKKNEIESSIVIQLPETKNNRFRNQNAKAVKQFTYKGNTLTEERKRDILEGLHNYLKTGEFNGKLADDVRSTTAYELQQNLAEQMTLGGIKKGLMTGVALATMFCNMPKLAAESKIINRDTLEETGIVQMETTLELVNYKDGSIAICNAGNKNKFLDIVIITNSDGTPVACYDYNVWKNNVIVNGELENAKRAKTKPIVVSMDAKKFTKFVNNWKNIGLTYYTTGGTISEFVKQNYVDLINGWIKGENLKQAEFMIQDSLTYGFTLNNKIYLNPELVNSNTIAHEYTHLWDKYTQKENPALWEHGKEIFKQTSLWNEVINDENYKAISNNEDLILSECHSRICGKFAEEVLNKIAKENGNEIKEKVIDWDKEVELFIAKEFGIKNPNYEMSNGINIKEQLAQENYNEFKNFLSQPMKDLIAGKEILKEHIIDNVELEKKLTNSTELNESINNDIPVMPNVSDLQHSESNEVQILKKELADVKAALNQATSQFEHEKKANSNLRQEIELLKGKNDNINATPNVKETGEESLYREETKDTGTEINFNRNTAFNINCPIPPFGHEKEDGSIEIIENAHFAKHLLNKYDSASNKVVLIYADETGKHHEIEMHEREYIKMINACEEFVEKKNGVAENSYEWYLLHERKAKIMKTDQNILRLNFACNFIHNYRIMCKLYASNEGEAVKQAQKLVDMMHPNERRTFNKWRKKVGEKAFDDLLLKEFRDHVQGIENKDSLILNNNELLYDVNKRYLEFQKDEEIVLTKYDKVIKNSGKKIGDTIKMAFKYESFGGKKLKTPMLEYQIVKVTKNQFPDTVLLYNAEQKITQTIPLKDFMEHVRKIEKQQLKENAEQIKKDFKKYGYEGR